MKKKLLVLAIVFSSIFAHSEIIYTEFNDTLKVSTTAEWTILKEVDLNDDGIIDTRIEWNNFDHVFQFGVFADGGTEEPGYVSSPESDPMTGVTLNTAFAIVGGDEIGDALSYHHPYPVTPNGMVTIDYEIGGEPFHWPMVDHYIGVKFMVEGSWHYGWIQVQRIVLDEDGFLSRSLVIKGMAAESVPDTPIIAGDWENEGTASLSNTVQDEVLIFPNPFLEKITITDLTLSTSSITIFTIEGRVVKKYSNFSGDKVEINLSQYKSGFFIVEISDVNGNIMHRQKVLKIEG